MLLPSLPTDRVYPGPYTHADRTAVPFTLCTGAVPSVGKDRHPPSLHLAEASIGELDVQR